MFFRDVYEKMKRDLRMSKDEQERLASAQPQQERTLSNLESSLQSMMTSKVSISRSLSITWLVNVLCWRSAVHHDTALTLHCVICRRACSQKWSRTSMPRCHPTTSRS